MKLGIKGQSFDFLFFSNPTASQNSLTGFFNQTKDAFASTINTISASPSVNINNSQTRKNSIENSGKSLQNFFRMTKQAQSQNSNF